MIKLRAFLLVFFFGCAGLLPVFAEEVTFNQDGCPPGASSQDCSAAQSDTPTEAARGIPSVLTNHLRNMVTQMEKLIEKVGTAGTFNELGKYIIAVLGTTVITWGILKNMILKSTITQIVADLVFPIVVIAMCVASLENNVLASKIVESVQSLAAGISPLGTATAAGFLDNMFYVMKMVWADSPQLQIWDLGSTYIASLLLQLIAELALMLGAVFGLGVLFMAKFQIAFAIALAPVMIPWLLFKPTEFLFSGWLTFLLKGGFVLVAVTVVTSLASYLMKGLVASKINMPPGLESVLAYGSITIAALLVAFLILKSAEIGGGIISGSSAGIAGFGRVAALGAAPALKGLKVTADGLSGTAKMGSAAAMGKMAQGKTDAQLSNLHKALRPTARSSASARGLYGWVRDKKPPSGGGAPPGGGGGGGTSP